ncbi:hypothetical protein GCM10010282_55140 [Streptomyces roseolus]|nr:hypothetical protein GCM10010282_55140 [Streptomyces roseolus]
MPVQKARPPAPVTTIARIPSSYRSPRAFAVRRPGARVTADVLIVWSRREMAHYKVPRQVEFVAELPRNASGKVVKGELRKRG